MQWNLLPTVHRIGAPAVWLSARAESHLSAMTRADKTSWAAGTLYACSDFEWTPLYTSERYFLFLCLIFFFSVGILPCFCWLSWKDLEGESVYSDRNNNFASAFYCFLCYNYLWFVLVCLLLLGLVGRLHVEGLWKEPVARTSTETVSKGHNNRKIWVQTLLFTLFHFFILEFFI